MAFMNKKRREHPKTIMVDLPVIYYTGENISGVRPKVPGVEWELIPIYQTSKVIKGIRRNLVTIFAYDKQEIENYISYFHNHRQNDFKMAVYHREFKENNYYEYEEEFKYAIELLYDLGYEHLNPEANKELAGDEYVKPPEPEKNEEQPQILPLKIPKRNYSKMKVYQLKTLLKNRGAVGYHRLKKEELVELLKTLDKEENKKK